MEKTKTSPGSWRTSLHRLFQQWTAQPANLPRIAILGIGNTLRSDDAAGILVARGLVQSSTIRDLDCILVMDAGHAPENRTAELRRFGPQVVILVDAAEMNEAPGTVRWIGMDEMDGMSASTHTMPLSMLAKYLTLEHDCDVKLLGIQPRSNEIGESVSAEVLQAVDEIVDELTKSLFEPTCM
jgi:hydrogenase 3 maturation protease